MPDADATVYHPNSLSILHFGILALFTDANVPVVMALHRDIEKRRLPHIRAIRSHKRISRRGARRGWEGGRGGVRHLENDNSSIASRSGHSRKRKKKEKSKNSTDQLIQCAVAYTDTRIRTSGTRVFLLSRSHVPHAYTHTHTRARDCHTVMHASVNYWSELPPFLPATATTCRVRPTAAGVVVVIPPGRRLADRCTTTRTHNRVRLPRLFKIPLTVCRPASTRRAAAQAAPSVVACDTSAMARGEGPWTRSYTRVFIRDATRTSPIRSSYHRRHNCQDGVPRMADHVIRRDVLMTYYVPCVKGPAKRPVTLVARSSRDRAHVRVQWEWRFPKNKGDPRSKWREWSWTIVGFRSSRY